MNNANFLLSRAAVLLVAALAGCGGGGGDRDWTKSDRTGGAIAMTSVFSDLNFADSLFFAREYHNAARVYDSIYDVLEQLLRYEVNSSTPDNVLIEKYRTLVIGIDLKRQLTAIAAATADQRQQLR